jgi:hypothetical protein
MLWAYVNDSIIRDLATGNAVTVGHGGGISEFNEWCVLERKWRQVLNKENIDTFRMADFETNDRKFQGWSREKREIILNSLLDIISEHVKNFVGYSVSATLGISFRDTHTASIGRMLHYCGDMALLGGEAKVHLVFARHPEVEPRRIDTFLENASRAFPEIASCIAASPVDCCALQAADLLAYELVRWKNAPDLANARYPIRTLMAGSSHPFRVFHASA